MNLHKLNLNALPVFLAAAETENLAQAAARLGLTPSAVSQSLARFEAALGVALFRRVGKRMSLSPEGRDFAVAARGFTAKLDESVTRLGGHDPVPRGEVRLGLFTGFSGDLFADFVSGFIRENPGIRLRVAFGSGASLDEALRGGRLDLAVSLRRNRDDERIAATALYEEDLVLVSARRPPRKALRVEDIFEAPFIDYYEHGPLIRRWIYFHFRRKPTTLNIRAFAATAELVLGMILRDAGIGVVPHSVAKPFIAEGRLHVIRGRQEQLRETTWIKEARSVRRSRAHEDFYRRLAESFRRRS
jgi:DNA-binding transcriptional LysR family regulator